MDLMETAPFIYGAFLTAGGVYILANLFLGGLGADADFGGADVDFDFDMDGSADAGDAEGVGISLNVIAAFCVGFGAVGLAGTLAEWSLLLTLLVALFMGLLVGRAFQKAMAFVLRQEGGVVINENSLMGTIARVTVPTPAGKMGEALIEEPERIKYTIRNIVDEPLAKGDKVRVVGVDEGRLRVQKINSE